MDLKCLCIFIQDTTASVSEIRSLITTMIRRDVFSKRTQREVYLKKKYRNMTEIIFNVKQLDKPTDLRIFVTRSEKQTVISDFTSHMLRLCHLSPLKLAIAVSSHPAKH